MGAFCIYIPHQKSARAQRPLCADARSSYFARRRGPRRHGCRFPQEVRHRGRRHRQEPLGVSPAAQFSRGHGGRDPLSPNAPIAPPAARGAGSTISRHISGLPWWPTIWPCSPASNWLSRPSWAPVKVKNRLTCPCKQSAAATGALRSMKMGSPWRRDRTRTTSQSDPNPPN
jgi:hypothetical protein